MDDSSVTLADFTTDDLRAEIFRREQVAEDAYWAKRIREAKYLCNACGMPDSHHTRDCPTDTDCT